MSDSGKCLEHESSEVLCRRMLAGERVWFGRGPCSFLGRRLSMHRKQPPKCQQGGSLLSQGLEGAGNEQLLPAQKQDMGGRKQIPEGVRALVRTFTLTERHWRVLSGWVTWYDISRRIIQGATLRTDPRGQGWKEDPLGGQCKKPRQEWWGFGPSQWQWTRGQILGLYQNESGQDSLLDS